MTREHTFRCKRRCRPPGPAVCRLLAASVLGLLAAGRTGTTAETVERGFGPPCSRGSCANPLLGDPGVPLLSDRRPPEPPMPGLGWDEGLRYPAGVAVFAPRDEPPPLEQAGPPPPLGASPLPLAPYSPPAQASEAPQGRIGSDAARQPESCPTCGSRLRAWLPCLFCREHPVADVVFSLFRPPQGRYSGRGRPLLRESWRYRPFSAGWFMGFVQGSPLVNDWVGQTHGFFGGYRLGWDYDDYWGCEMRFGFGSTRVWDSQRAKGAQAALDDARGIDPDDPFRLRFEQDRDCDLSLWDIELLYYPWGESAWRPYFLVGLGTTKVTFMDRLSQYYDEITFAMPVAIGLKCRYNSRIAFRFELADNMAFPRELNVLHHLSFTAGMEVRFGGTRKAYWPWNPGRHYF